MLNMLFEAWKMQPFKLNKRTYPVGLQLPINNTYLLTLTLIQEVNNILNTQVVIKKKE